MLATEKPVWGEYVRSELVQPELLLRPKQLRCQLLQFREQVRQWEHHRRVFQRELLWPEHVPVK